jgi:hypothetical protein
MAGGRQHAAVQVSSNTNLFNILSKHCHILILNRWTVGHKIFVGVIFFVSKYEFFTKKWLVPLRNVFVQHSSTLIHKT